MTSINQFKAEQKVDIFHLIRTMRTQRPGVVANIVSYLSPMFVTSGHVIAILY